MRQSGTRRFITDPGHRPERHRAVIELSHQRLLERAEAIGPATAAVLREQMHRRVHPAEALRSSLGKFRLRCQLVVVPTAPRFLEHDRTGAIEREIPLDQFPAPDELWARYSQSKGYTPTRQAVAIQDY